MNTPITFDRLTDFMSLVIGVREMQREYRRTLDSRLRARLPLLEEQLDRDAARMTADLKAAAEDAERELIAEGGAA